MDIRDGSIIDKKELEEIKKEDANAEKFLKEISEQDMTAKQLKKKKVSKYDNRSPLGKLRKTEIEKIGRNEPCPCDSGKKFKKCCLYKKGGG